MDTLTCVPTTWRGVAATLIVGTELEAVLTTVGGHLACLRYRGEELNPLWQPPWAASDPRTVKPSPTGTYGDGREAALLASIVGSNLCCDRFGAPWPGEDKPLHGEAGVARYTVSQSKHDRVDLTTWLPVAKLTVERHIHLVGRTLWLATTLRHLGGEAREVEWCEHTNLGDPFLDGVEIAADVDLAVNLHGTPEPGFARYGSGAEIPLDVALRVPGAKEPDTGLFATARVKQGQTATWTATNARLRRRLRAEFHPHDFPWLGLWTQHRARTSPPWSARTRVRGMELSSKPFPEGKPPASRATHYLGRPTTCRIPPGKGEMKVIRFSWERL